MNVLRIYYRKIFVLYELDGKPMRKISYKKLAPLTVKVKVLKIPFGKLSDLIE